ncbi:MAG: 2-amino-4-hydroxy-6-hydroxymethyldihydropteridine diphosphokinase [Sulfobacillus thermotolerans]|uniref:2-amino-4-hydroxy-6-hydroxymethyldihydropteridine diphosphokinase n=1 Tax=Sulfobacillus thermotolerans TaxID=338644 RepID=A0ABM6RNG1_9FIRM|nr:2-amino-4-hydroxy-6-hydroxymethyldihydropteridine diphosphokinase [Sulfobacillus thermotolerans]MCY0907291.1 2-amino-4-hydroxy-6-hydroxymethyldihydropteridine diphosphokinase [Sulfobacillus thermotolerans]
MPKVYIGFGGNLGNPLGCFAQGLEWLQGAGRVTGCSGIYRTAPQGGPSQPDYLNAVLCLDTLWDWQRLLGQMQAAEAACGRERGERFGPRTLDLDILLWGEERIDEPQLQVPHPRLAQRRFVLEPLAEIDPQLTIPGVGHIQGLLAAVANQPVTRLMNWTCGGSIR